MKKEVNLGEEKVTPTFRQSGRAKRMSLTVHPDGEIVVTFPRRASEKTAERFLIEKSDWVLRKIRHIRSLGKRLFLKHSKKEFEEKKAEALALVTKKVIEYNKHYKFVYKNITIRNQKTRWGSCSAKGNLNFNYKIALIPESLADYIVVHELCHLGQFNHSRAFWDLVAETIPNYRELRAELRRIGIRYS